MIRGDLAYRLWIEEPTFATLRAAVLSTGEDARLLYRDEEGDRCVPRCPSSGSNILHMEPLPPSMIARWEVLQTYQESPKAAMQKASSVSH